MDTNDTYILFCVLLKDSLRAHYFSNIDLRAIKMEFFIARLKSKQLEIVVIILIWCGLDVFSYKQVTLQPVCIYICFFVQNFTPKFKSTDRAFLYTILIDWPAVYSTRALGFGLID